MFIVFYCILYDKMFKLFGLILSILYHKPIDTDIPTVRQYCSIIL